METLHGWHFFAGDISKPDIVAFVEKANLHYPTNKFITDILWDNVFRHSCIRRHKIQEKVILYVKTHFQQTETFQHTHFAPCHPLICQRRSLKPLKNVWLGRYFKLKKKTLDGQGLPTQFEKKVLSEINETHRNWKSALLKLNSKEEKEMLSFVTQYHPLVSTLKEALMEKRNLIQNH